HAVASSRTQADRERGDSRRRQSLGHRSVLNESVKFASTVRPLEYVSRLPSAAEIHPSVRQREVRAAGRRWRGKRSCRSLDDTSNGGLAGSHPLPAGPGTAPTQMVLTSARGRGEWQG